MKCKKCNEEMLPAGRDYTYEVYECQECGYEELVDEDGEVMIDYQWAWRQLSEWLDEKVKKSSGTITKKCMTSIKQKMAEILKEQV